MLAVLALTGVIAELGGRILVCGKTKERAQELADGKGITAVAAKDLQRQEFSQVDMVVLADAEDFTAQDWQSIVVSIPEESLVLIAEGEGMIAESFFEKLKNSEEFASLFLAQKAIVPHLPQRCEAGRERMTDQMVAG